jgi:benzoate membrane transport protein
MADAKHSLRLVSLLPTFAAGAIAVLVGFTSAIAILFQATHTMGASLEQTSSLVAALCFGAGVTTLGFSIYYKKPILCAFSTTGAALLASNANHASMNELVGAFLFCGLLITLAGLTGWFERVLNRIPTAIASAMLAGVLFRFCVDIFSSMKTQGGLVAVMLLTYLITKRWLPRFSVIAVLVTGLIATWHLDLMHFEQFRFQISTLVFTAPQFSAATMIGIGIPLFIVTMASQNLPGIAVMRANGYQPPISQVVTGTGLATFILAPFGAFGINFAAITAAIVMGPEAHEDSTKRYIGAVTAGVLYVGTAIFAATVSLFFKALPSEFVLSLAGIALIGTVSNSIAIAVSDEPSRESAVLTFLVTASGMTYIGIGSAFWGLVLGAFSFLIFRFRK